MRPRMPVNSRILRILLRRLNRQRALSIYGVDLRFWQLDLRLTTTVFQLKTINLMEFRMKFFKEISGASASLTLVLSIYSNPAVADRNSCIDDCGATMRRGAAASQSTGDSCRSCCSAVSDRTDRSICENRCSQTQNAEFSQLHSEMYRCSDRCRVDSL